MPTRPLTPKQLLALDALRDGGTVADVAGRLESSKLAAYDVMLALCDAQLISGMSGKFTLTAAGKAAWLGSLR